MFLVLISFFCLIFKFLTFFLIKKKIIIDFTHFYFLITFCYDNYFCKLQYYFKTVIKYKII